MAARSSSVLATRKDPTGEIRKWPNNHNEEYWLEQDDIGCKAVGSNLGTSKVFVYKISDKYNPKHLFSTIVLNLIMRNTCSTFVERKICRKTKKPE